MRTDLSTRSRLIAGLRAHVLRAGGTGMPALLIAAVIVSMFTASAEATHNRSGHIHWSPGAEENQIRFSVQNAWRRDGYSEGGSASCVDVTQPGAPNTACSGDDGHPLPGDIIHEGIGSGHVLHLGDGNSISSPRGQLLYLVTSVDLVNNWFFGVAIDPATLPVNDPSEVSTVIRHTYDEPGDYLAFTESCCRISGSAFPNRHINNASGWYRFETLVNVGTGNASPVSLMPPIVFCRTDEVCEFPVPAADPDGDNLRFRLADPNEAGSGFTQPGHGQSDVDNATIDELSGIYTWDTTDASLGGVDPTEWNVLYSTQVVVEDLDDLGEVKSKVVVDFFIQLVPEVGEPPQFNEPDPDEPLVIEATTGETITFPVTVTGGTPAGSDAPGGDNLADDLRTTNSMNGNGRPSAPNFKQADRFGGTKNVPIEVQAADGDDEVTLNVVGMPSGATMDPPLPMTGQTVSSEFSWTPSEDQTGTFIIIFTAITKTGQSATIPVTINVEEVTVIPGDLNFDDIVDDEDLAIFMNAYGSCEGDPSFNALADYNGDGCVGMADLAMWYDFYLCFIEDPSCPDDDNGDPASCGDAGAGDCCEAHGTPYCDDEDCCEQICDSDPFCCNTEWDSLCASAANAECDVCDE